MSLGIASCTEQAAKSLGYGALKEEQTEAISQFVSGRDVFVALPTGYGKSLCYCCLPYVFDYLRSVDNQSIVLFVNPLVALMKDQVAVYSSKGLATAYVSAEPGYRDTRQGMLLEGRCTNWFLYQSRVAVYWNRTNTYIARDAIVSMCH